jgi:hypothetical protein
MDGAVFIDAEDGEEMETTTENERDTALKDAALAQRQVGMLQATVKRMIGEQQQAQVQAAAVVAPLEPDDLDLWRVFPGDPSMLPAIGTMDAEAATTMKTLHGLLSAIPWGEPLPTLQFGSLGALPSFIHSLMGDTMWEACWGDQQDVITNEHFVPYKIMNLVKYAVDRNVPTLSDDEKTNGAQRYTAITAASVQRRKGRTNPYTAS